MESGFESTLIVRGVIHVTHAELTPLSRLLLSLSPALCDTDVSVFSLTWHRPMGRRSGAWARLFSHQNVCQARASAILKTLQASLTNELNNVTAKKGWILSFEPKQVRLQSHALSLALAEKTLTGCSVV